MNVDYNSINQFWILVSLKKAIQADVKAMWEKISCQDKRKVQQSEVELIQTQSKVAYADIVVKRIDVYMEDLAGKCYQTCKDKRR